VRVGGGGETRGMKQLGHNKAWLPLFLAVIPGAAESRGASKSIPQRMRHARKGLWLWMAVRRDERGDSRTAEGAIGPWTSALIK